MIAKYQGKEIDPREAGRNYVFTPFFQPDFYAPAKSFVSRLNLLDVLDAATFSGATASTPRARDILALQDGIAPTILEGLRLELTDLEAEKLGKRATDNAEAWEEYLRGRDNFGRFIFRTIDAEDCDAAMANFKRAIELDPHFALAYSGLGACYANRVFKGLGEPEDYTYAEAAFSKAFFYDQNVVEARVLMVMIYMARGEKKEGPLRDRTAAKTVPERRGSVFCKRRNAPSRRRIRGIAQGI